MNQPSNGNLHSSFGKGFWKGFGKGFGSNVKVIMITGILKHIFFNFFFIRFTVTGMCINNCKRNHCKRNHCKRNNCKRNHCKRNNCKRNNIKSLYLIKGWFVACRRCLWRAVGVCGVPSVFVATPKHKHRWLILKIVDTNPGCVTVFPPPWQVFVGQYDFFGILVGVFVPVDFQHLGAAVQ